LQYENRRAAYVDAIWTVINWTEAEQRYKSTRDQVFKNLGIDLKGL
jgi:superoxide dismutase, Fe-Mn family